MEIVPAELTTAIADAVVPIPGPLMVTEGAVVYPEPPSVIVTTPTTLSLIIVVAAAPTPSLLLLNITTPGLSVYPIPGFCT